MSPPPHDPAARHLGVGEVRDLKLPWEPITGTPHLRLLALGAPPTYLGRSAALPTALELDGAHLGLVAGADVLAIPRGQHRAAAARLALDAKMPDASRDPIKRDQRRVTRRMDVIERVVEKAALLGRELVALHARRLGAETAGEQAARGCGSI